MSTKGTGPDRDRQTYARYSFANLINSGEPENLDTSIVDLTRESMRVIQSGDTALAREFIRSESFLLFQDQLRKIPDYIATSYTFFCVAAYIMAMGVISSYTDAERLLARLTLAPAQTPEGYMEAMGETAVAFTAIVEKEKGRKQGTGPVLRARAFIEDHLYARFELEELAAYCGCSLSYLRHRFKEETGLSLVSYIHEKKIDRAKQMLRETDHTAAQIGSQLGFCTESYFISVFKKVTGSTPRAYREANR